MKITVREAAEKFNLTIVAGENSLNNEITGVYVCDLLSWVMGRAEENSAWITIQGHINIVAVALLTGVSCIIVAEDAEIDNDTIEKANSEDIPVLKTAMTSYEMAVSLSKSF